jgi:hypothetical protein
VLAFGVRAAHPVLQTAAHSAPTVRAGQDSGWNVPVASGNFGSLLLLHVSRWLSTRPRAPEGASSAQRQRRVQVERFMMHNCTT